MERTCSLLAELQSAFPLRATAAVAGSLVYWQRWMEANRDNGDAVRQALFRQGELWRSLLTGETRADDLLGLGDYRQAFRDYTRQVALLARKYPLMWLLVVTLLAGTGVGIWAIIKYAPTGAAVIAGVIAAAAGALGVTWKTVAVTLGKASVLLERPMVEDGLREAVKFAAFIRPVEMTPADMALLRKEVRIEGRKRPQRELGSSAEATVPQPRVTTPRAMRRRQRTSRPWERRRARPWRESGRVTRSGRGALPRCP